MGRLVHVREGRVTRPAITPRPAGVCAAIWLALAAACWVEVIAAIGGVWR